MSQAFHGCEAINGTFVTKCIDKQVFDSSMLSILQEAFPAEPIWLGLERSVTINIALVILSLIIAIVGFYIARVANKAARDANNVATKAIQIQNEQQYMDGFYLLLGRFDRHNLNLRFSISEDLVEKGYDAIRHLSSYISVHDGNLRMENHSDIASSQGIVITKRYCLRVVYLADHISSNLYDVSQRPLIGSAKCQLEAVLKNSLDPYEIKLIAEYCIAENEHNSKRLMKYAERFGLFEGIDESLFSKEDLQKFKLDVFGTRHKEIEAYLKTD